MPNDIVPDCKDLGKQPAKYALSKAYWEDIEPTIDGMLGGFSRISAVDSSTSVRFLSEFFDVLGSDKHKGQGDQKNDDLGPKCVRKRRALDCGAGIGRVTKHVLLKYFDTVDLLEQNQTFLDKSKEYIGEDKFNKQVGELLCVGIQDFAPREGIKYDLVWCQWVCCYLPDNDFIDFLHKCQSCLTEDGIIVIKDNHSSSDEPNEDMSDSSIIRPYKEFIDLFKKAGLTILSERRQYKFPKGLYPVKMFAMR